MKLGISTWVWNSPLSNTDLISLIPKISNMGYDLVEIPIENSEDIDYSFAKKLLDKHELMVSTCAVLGKDCDLLLPGDSCRQNGINYLKNCIDITKRLGGTNLVGPFYSSPGRLWRLSGEEREGLVASLAEQLKHLSEYAMKQNIVLCIEPLNRYETSFLNTSTQAIELIDLVDHPACKILLDIFHMNIEEKSICDSIRKTGASLGHLHVSSNFRGTPGEGNIPWNEIFNTLKEIEFDGCVVIESFTPYVEKIATGTATWNPLATSQDALAESGIKFLQTLFQS